MPINRIRTDGNLAENNLPILSLTRVLEMGNYFLPGYRNFRSTLLAGEVCFPFSRLQVKVIFRLKDEMNEITELQAKCGRPPFVKGRASPRKMSQRFAVMTSWCRTWEKVEHHHPHCLSRPLLHHCQFNVMEALEGVGHGHTGPGCLHVDCKQSLKN